MEQIPFTAVILAGGIGTRLGGTKPKQYLPLKNKPIIAYSIDLFSSLPELRELIIVCQPEYRSVLDYIPKHLSVKFALPGKRRQDSLLNALDCIEGDPLVCIHDGARPLIQAESVRKVVKAGADYEAAALGVPIKSTIKICSDEQLVLSTAPRAYLWEIQTPQVIRYQLLREAFKYANENELAVTDDVSLVEHLGKPVKIVEGSYTNIKITTVDDLVIADHFLNNDLFL